MKRLFLFLVTVTILFSITLPSCISENGNGNGNGGDGEEGTASFSLSNLSISSEEVYPNEIVAISVYVSNTGSAQGSYNVILKINGVQENTKTVSLGPYHGQSVLFAVSKQSVGTYNVAIGNLSGSFTVKSTPTDSLVVHFIDVGQGDSILIDLGDTEILIDGGGRNSGVVTYINAYVDGNIEVIVATHPHADHIGGLIEVFNSFVIGELWHSGDTSTSQTYSDFENAFQAEGCQIRTLTSGNILSVSDLVFEVFHPASLTGSTNNQSIVLYLAYGEIEFLFTGDAEQEAEVSMIASGLLSDIDILKVGHHGSRTSSSLSFLNTIKPEVAIYMAGAGNSYGHPHEVTIITLTNIGAAIYGTDVHGDVIVITNGITYNIQVEKQAPPITTSSSSGTTTNPNLPTPPSGGPVNVQITNIFYDGTVPQVESDEYVEITNLGTEPVNLQGWKLIDIDEGYPSFIFPSYILNPGQSIRVYTNEIHLEYGGFSFGRGSAVWNNSDPDTAVLYDAEGQEVSRKSY